MKKKRRNRPGNWPKLLLAVWCLVGAAFLTDRDIAKAAQKELEVLPTTVSTPSDGCTFVGIEGEYAAQVQDALDRVNEIRKEACQEGVPDPSDPDRKLKAADYVPIQGHPVWNT